ICQKRLQTLLGVSNFLNLSFQHLVRAFQLFLGCNHFDSILAQLFLVSAQSFSHSLGFVKQPFSLGCNFNIVDCLTYDGADLICKVEHKARNLVKEGYFTNTLQLFFLKQRDNNDALRFLLTQKSRGDIVVIFGYVGAVNQFLFICRCTNQSLSYSDFIVLVESASAVSVHRSSLEYLPVIVENVESPLNPIHKFNQGFCC